LPTRPEVIIRVVPCSLLQCRQGRKEWIRNCVRGVQRCGFGESTLN